MPRRFWASDSCVDFVALLQSNIYPAADAKHLPQHQFCFTDLDWRLFTTRFSGIAGHALYLLLQRGVVAIRHENTNPINQLLMCSHYVFIYLVVSRKATLLTFMRLHTTSRNLGCDRQP